MDSELKELIVKRRIEKSKETIIEAKLALDNNQFRSALNRMYYAIFYIVSSLAAKHDFATSKHKQLMGWFNKEFIKPGQIKSVYWDIYSKSYKNRQESDYLDFVEYSKEEIESNYSDMLSFVTEIENLINRN
jgi:uncharacterized protein (UPF0332 family)